MEEAEDAAYTRERWVSGGRRRSSPRDARPKTSEDAPAARRPMTVLSGGRGAAKAARVPRAGAKAVAPKAPRKVCARRPAVQPARFAPHALGSAAGTAAWRAAKAGSLPCARLLPREPARVRHSRLVQFLCASARRRRSDKGCRHEDNEGPIQAACVKWAREKMDWQVVGSAQGVYLPLKATAAALKARGARLPASPAQLHRRALGARCVPPCAGRRARAWRARPHHPPARHGRLARPARRDQGAQRQAVGGAAGVAGGREEPRLPWRRVLFA